MILGIRYIVDLNAGHFTPGHFPLGGSDLFPPGRFPRPDNFPPNLGHSPGC